jgi:hypothetical protein
MSDKDPLHDYLRDHQAGAMAGSDLAKRMARHASGTPLSEIAAEIEADRQTLREVMSAVDSTPARAKPLFGWLAEKATRVRPGRRGSAGPSRADLLELEALIAGVSGKLQLWRALGEIAATEPRLRGFDFVALSRRAEDQRRRLEEQHAAVAREALRQGP